MTTTDLIVLAITSFFSLYVRIIICKSTVLLNLKNAVSNLETRTALTVLESMALLIVTVILLYSFPNTAELLALTAILSFPGMVRVKPAVIDQHLRDSIFWRTFQGGCIILVFPIIVFALIPNTLLSVGESIAIFGFDLNRQYELKKTESVFNRTEWELTNSSVYSGEKFVYTIVERNRLNIDESLKSIEKPLPASSDDTANLHDPNSSNSKYSPDLDTQNNNQQTIGIRDLYDSIEFLKPVPLSPQATLQLKTIPDQYIAIATLDRYVPESLSHRVITLNTDAYIVHASTLKYIWLPRNEEDSIFINGIYYIARLATLLITISLAAGILIGIWVFTGLRFFYFVITFSKNPLLTLKLLGPLWISRQFDNSIFSGAEILPNHPLDENFHYVALPREPEEVYRKFFRWGLKYSVLSTSLFSKFAFKISMPFGGLLVFATSPSIMGSHSLRETAQSHIESRINIAFLLIALITIVAVLAKLILFLNLSAISDDWRCMANPFFQHYIFPAGLTLWQLCSFLSAVLTIYTIIIYDRYARQLRQSSVVTSFRTSLRLAGSAWRIRAILGIYTLFCLIVISIPQARQSTTLNSLTHVPLFKKTIECKHPIIEQFNTTIFGVE